MGNTRWYTKVEESVYRPRHIAAFILKTVYLSLQKNYPGLQIESVTITIPASFSSKMRIETIEAARISGFETDKLHLLDEPVAAIFSKWDNEADCFNEIPNDSNILVFDMGGGTLDASIINISTNNHIIRVLSTSRYNELAGNDIDIEIAALMLQKIWIAMGYSSLSDFLEKEIKIEDRLHFSYKIMEHAGAFKMQLSDALRNGPAIPLRDRLEDYCSNKESLDFQILPHIEFKSNILNHINIPIHEVLKVIEPLISFQKQYRGKDKINIFNPIDQAIERAKFNYKDISAIGITGGSSYFTPVTNEVFGYFNTKKQVLLDAFFAVADGAVNWSYLKRSNLWTINEIFGDRIFLKREGMPFLEIMTNLTVPSDPVERIFDDEICFYTSQKSRGVTLEFFQGDSPEDHLMVCTHIERQIFPRELSGDIRLNKVIGQIDKNKVFQFEMVFKDEIGDIKTKLDFELDSFDNSNKSSISNLSGIILNGEVL